MSAKKERSRFTRSNAWLRRARRHFCLLNRAWVEAARTPIQYRERMSRLGLAMYEHGLLAGSPMHEGRFTVMSNWRKADGISWWPWREANEFRRVACMWRGDFRRYQTEKRKARSG